MNLKTSMLTKVRLDNTVYNLHVPQSFLKQDKPEIKETYRLNTKILSLIVFSLVLVLYPVLFTLYVLSVIISRPIFN